MSINSARLRSPSFAHRLYESRRALHVLHDIFCRGVEYFAALVSDLSLLLKEIHDPSDLIDAAKTHERAGIRKN